MSNGGSSGGGGGSYNKAGALLLAAIGGIIGFIILSGGGDDGGKGPASLAPTSAPQVVATGVPAATQRPSSTNAQPGSFDKEALRLGDSNNVVLTITAYGMPARVGVTAQNDSEVQSRGMFVAGKGVNTACLPDVQYPDACVTYIVVRRGTVVTVTAGEARAGFWPVFERLRGGGCDREGTGGQDVTCTLTLFQDADIVATYYGDTTPSGRYAYPKCPVASERGTSTSAWIARCQ